MTREWIEKVGAAASGTASTDRSNPRTYLFKVVQGLSSQSANSGDRHQRRVWRFLRLDGQGNGEGRAFTRLALHSDLTVQ